MWVLIHTAPKSSRARHPQARGRGPWSRRSRSRPYCTPLAHASASRLVAEPLDGHDRAEDLVLDLLVVLLQARDARSARRSSPRSPCRAPPAWIVGVVGQPVDHAADVGELVGVVERAVVGRPRRRAARSASPSAASASAATNSSWTPACTSTRVAAVQSWPALNRPAPAMPSAAVAMSASSNTTTGALPPSSRCTRFRSGGRRARRPPCRRAPSR